MNGENKRDKQAVPRQSERTAEKKKKENACRHVKKKIRQMIPARIQTENFVVQHQGHPRQRNPHGAFHRCERPGDALAGQSGLHIRIVGHIKIVVKRDETKTGHLMVSRVNRGNENEDRDEFDMARTKPDRFVRSDSGFFVLIQSHIFSPYSCFLRNRLTNPQTI